MVSSDVVCAGEEDRERAKHSVVLSFAADPMMRWMVPDAADYLATMPEVFEAFAGASFENRTAYIARNAKAVALWLPPDVESDNDRMTAALRKVVAPELYEDIAAVFGEMGRYHPRDEPCWYLPLIGVDPAEANQGLGSALMKKALDHCDEAGLPAYLDSSNPRNIAFYERHGFKVMGEIQSGSSPVVHPMLRKHIG